MRKFMKPSRIGSFRIERTRSTYWTPNSCFRAFRTFPLQHELRCKSGWTGVINAQVRATMSRRIFSQQRFPIHAIGPQTHVLGHFAPFHFWMNFGAKRNERIRCTPLDPKLLFWGGSGIFRYCTTFVGKWAKLVLLMHKFVQWSRVGIFCNERPRSTPLDPKLMFWGITDRTITARTWVQIVPNWGH
jgi:hypothetical protein